jgi:hypothetical protein
MPHWGVGNIRQSGSDVSENLIKRMVHIFKGKGNIVHDGVVLVVRVHPLSPQTIRSFRYKIFSNIPTRSTVNFHGRVTYYPSIEIVIQIFFKMC